MSGFNGILPVGIRYGDATLTGFSVHSLTAGDEMDIADECVERGETGSGAIELARLACCVTIECLPPEKMNVDLIRSMCVLDVQAIQKAKKSFDENFTETPVVVS